jgi:hypothetical protein
MPMSTKCQKNENKITINVIQHDDDLWHLRLFYNGAFSIASNNDLDNQNLLLATVPTLFILSYEKIMQKRIDICYIVIAILKRNYRETLQVYQITYQ